MLTNAKYVKFVREHTGRSMVWCKTASELLLKEGYDIYSDEAIKKMMVYYFIEKVYRYMKYLEIESLFKEFGEL